MDLLCRTFVFLFHFRNFYPRDAMLSRIAMALCLSVCPCLSVASRSSIETDERIELVFGTGASVNLSYTVL